MLKLLKFSMVLLCLVTSYAFAQSFLDQPTTAKSAPQSGNAMTPDDFRNAVKQIHQNNMTQLKEEAKQLLPPPATNANKNAATPSSQPASNPSSDNPFSSYSNSTQTPPQPGAASGSPSTKPSDNYTGFGGGSGSGGTKKSNTPASSGSSGGWNINY